MVKLRRNEGKQLDLFSWKPKKVSSNLSDYSNWKLSIGNGESEKVYREMRCTHHDAKILFGDLSSDYFEETSDDYDYDDGTETKDVDIKFTITSPNGKSYSLCLVYKVSVYTNGWYDPGSAWGYGEDPPDGGYYAEIEFAFDGYGDDYENDFEDNKEQEEILWGIMKTFIEQYGKHLECTEEG